MNKDFMLYAIDMAKQYLPSPNPRVGCVIVKDDNIIGFGAHIKAGEAHAEVNAVNSCTESTKGADVYVTLEPCSHFGKTPPCADMLCKLGIKNVYIGMKDPDEKVSGKGIEKLKAAGINVVVGICEEECREMNKGYIKHRTTGLPYIVLKSAMTLDGKIATRSGDSKWITSAEALSFSHKQRKESDAIMVGGNTEKEDNPTLTARCETVTYPNRIVLTSRKINKNANIFTVPGKVFICSLLGDFKEEKENNGICEIVHVTAKNLVDLLKYFASCGIMRLLVEGGGTLVGSFLKEKLGDELMLYYGAKIIGDAGAVCGISNISVDKLSDAINVEIVDIIKFRKDFVVKAKPIFK
ncbi:MAG: bifunctional diaminohydroxyphosphoribosylaminopyrimidine deaminase/5-amino-6-(5-phosphoribosylamino)uracil reductase RibD [Abditibacteriota bacterium]|nr:bifunctional diaminohydroxyphosphoribosylaminopyrimidine deaminase/5-amino-6-(5-phosphoribosylamino)uracil reductase RibD [Abditibacteriota bacterium]